MKNFEKNIKILIEKMRAHRSWLLVLSAIVVFVTTYALILPAMTLEHSRAVKQGGIDLPDAEAVYDKDDEHDAADDQADAKAHEDEDADAHDALENNGVSADNDAFSDNNRETSAGAGEASSTKAGSPAEAAGEGSKSAADSVTDGTSAQDSASAKKAGPVSLTYEGEAFTVAVEGKDAGLTDDMSVEVSEIDKADKHQKKEYEALYKDALKAVQDEKDGENVTDFAFAKFYDISIKDGEQTVEPGDSVDVKISYEKELRKELAAADPDKVRIIHFAEDKATGEVTPQVLDTKDTDITVKHEQVAEAAFKADSFSVYALVYTVDFHWEVDGKKFDFSIPGGGSISLAELVETLGIAGKETAAGKSAKEFVDEVEKVEFSNPELVWVGKVGSKSTVGELKEANGLDVEYSAELTDEQIEEINAKSVEAGAWALISKRPFKTEETLTVTMKDGERFTINVTDAQISANVLTADGKTYKITVTYDDDAQIPDGTELVVKEIPQDSDEYIQHLGQTWMEINKEYFEVEELRKNYTEDMGFLPEVNLKNLDSARFFDIRLLYRDKEIEPAAAVHVEISLVEGLKVEDDATAGIAHFSDEGLEIIDDVETEKEDSSVICFSYDQNSFSDTGTFVSHETHDIGMTAASKLTNSFDALQAGNEDSGSDELAKPKANKTLTPNESASGQKDGTYTLTLSVSGTSKKNSYSDVNKSNVLIVMDRSSSMTSNHTYVKATGRHDSNLTYYGVLSGEISDRNRVELSYWDNKYHYYSYSRWHEYNGVVYNRKTRLAAEQDALASLITQLTDKNKPGQTVTDEDGNTISLEDIIEVKLISFASGRTDKDKANGFKRNGHEVDTKNTTFDNTESGWGTTYSDGGTLKNAVIDNSVAKGTNWQEAMQYAKEIADAKKAEQPDEPVYVVFLTDGEPTDIEGDNGNAQWYQDNEKCLKAAEPDAKAIVDPHTVTSNGNNVTTDHKFYGIFTYGDTDDMKNYLRRLVNYAYGKGDNGASNITGGAADYYFDADSTSALLNAFQHIMSQVSESVAYGKVSITDGLTTDAMTTTLVHGQAEGYKYTVTGPLGELYSVTAKSPGVGQTDPTVTFTVNGHDYPGVKKTTTIDGSSYDYWSYTVGEGENAIEYKMTLADVSTDGLLTWDLTGIGTLTDGYTYSASFVVWPDQDAYDYVSALNNGLSKIKNSKGEEVDVVWDDNKAKDTGKGYKKGGVEKYPSIVKYDNGTFAVLTNTDQQVHYSIVETKIENGETTTTYDGPYSHTLPTPEPMPLTASASAIEKVWNVDRDPDVLARLLYGTPGHPENPYNIAFEILQDENEEPYVTVSLGWDQDKKEYIWNSEDLIYVKWDDSDGKYVKCSKDDEGAKPIGTHWAKDFSIATGLILSEARMTALGLDKTAYKSTKYSGTNYYLLEEGHDYTINEPNVGYEFDFDAPVYHPMLVDGVLKNVDLDIVRDSSGKIVSFRMTGISDIEGAESGRSALTIVNTLRGYIHLNKIVVDKDNNPLPKDDTKFEYTITLTNNDPVFKDDSIPWYGINGLFYHDENFNYYQAEKGPSADTLSLKDEQGNKYIATCQGVFNPDIIGPTQVKYKDNSGNEKTIQLYGNQMTVTAADGNDNDGYKKTSTTLKINQSEVVNIANVPVNSTYEITEIQSAGYDLVSVTKKVGTGDSESSKALTVSGTIVTNTDNNITYRNRRDKADLEIYKVDKDSLDRDTKTYLKDAEFTITQLDEEGTGNYKLDPKSETTPKALYYQKAFVTDENGKITIEGLTPGYYEIKEADAPDGYNITDQIEYIKVENGIITRLSKLENDPETDENEGLITGWPVNNDNSGMFRFTAATDSEKASFMVGNEPGVELPHTGGIGTTIFYIIGSLLVVGCAVVLAARRRTQSARH